MTGTISTVLFVRLKEKVSPVISLCSHIVHDFEGEKNDNICAWVRVRFNVFKVVRG